MTSHVLLVAEAQEPQLLHPALATDSPTGRQHGCLRGPACCALLPASGPRPASQLLNFRSPSPARCAEPLNAPLPHLWHLLPAAVSSHPPSFQPLAPSLSALKLLRASGTRSSAFLVGCPGACAVAVWRQAEQFILEKGVRSLKPGFPSRSRRGSSGRAGQQRAWDLRCREPRNCPNWSHSRQSPVPHKSQRRGN